MRTATSSTNLEVTLADAVAEFYADPRGFALWAFPWGEGDLAGFEGPDDWQNDFFDDVGAAVRERAFDGVHPVDPVLLTTASGHGIGKSAEVAMLILWLMSTRPFAKGVVTASTYPQLRTKTWGELAKWKRRCITGHWFTLTSGQNLSMYHNAFPDSWRVDGQTCREENSEAFAGLHAANSTPFYIFDEASGVPDKIEEVAQGGLTDGEPHFYAFGNPTRNSGWFHDITFGTRKRHYITRSIDSRTCKLTNKALLNRWEQEHGEDSDFYRVRVRGLPPSQGDVQFIPRHIVQAGRKREALSEPFNPYIVGVDVARFGKHRSVIYTRRGRDARTVPPKMFRGLSTMQLADEILLHVAELGRHNVGAIFIDGGGVGGGVVDRCRQLGLDVVDVNFAARTPKHSRFMNMRAHMYGELRGWLAEGGAIRDSDDLETELVVIEFGYNRNNQIQLEDKDDVVDRLGDEASPDEADALALTFAHPVAPLQHTYPHASPRRAMQDAQQHNYGPGPQAPADYDPIKRMESV